MFFGGDDINTLLMGYVLQILILSALFFALEKFRPLDSKIPFFKKDFKIEFLYMVMNDILFGPLLTITLTFVFAHTLFVFMPDRLFEGPIAGFPFLLQIALATVFLDFLTYWRHRFTHYYWWHYHAIHHSAEEINWLTKTRLHPLDLAAALIFDITGLHLIGFSPDVIYFASIVTSSVDYFAHMNFDITLSKPWRYLINNPRLHRWHHANHIEAYNKNFCSVYPFLDVLFGTYHYPEGRLPEKYGISPKEQAKLPQTYLRQVVHPVRQHHDKIRLRLGRFSGKPPKNDVN